MCSSWSSAISKGSSIKDVRTGGGRGISWNADKSGQEGRGDFSASGRPHFTQHVGQEDSVTTLACKLCIQYIAQGINAGIRHHARPLTHTTTVCSVCCCSTLPSLNYPWQLALMAAMTNSYLVLHARPVGHKATVQASSAVGVGQWV